MLEGGDGSPAVSWMDRVGGGKGAGRTPSQHKASLGAKCGVAGAEAGCNAQPHTLSQADESHALPDDMETSQDLLKLAKLSKSTRGLCG